MLIDRGIRRSAYGIAAAQERLADDVGGEFGMMMKFAAALVDLLWSANLMMPNKARLLDLPHELQEYLFAHFDVQSVRLRSRHDARTSKADIPLTSGSLTWLAILTAHTPVAMLTDSSSYCSDLWVPCIWPKPLLSLHDESFGAGLTRSQG